MRFGLGGSFLAALCFVALSAPVAYGQAAPKPNTPVTAAVVDAPVAKTSVAKVPKTTESAAAKTPTTKTSLAKAPAAKAAAAKTSAAKSSHGTVYLLRGLADVFSLGMNTLTDELRAKGVRATVTNHAQGERVTNEIIAAYKKDPAKALPVVLIGHSLGANKTLIIASRLQREGIPVRLVVLFDATQKIPVPGNVAEVLNLHKPGAFGKTVAGGKTFKGSIDNRDVSDIKGIGHVSIDKSKKLHGEVVAKVLKVLAEKPRIPKKK